MRKIIVVLTSSVFLGFAIQGWSWCASYQSEDWNPIKTDAPSFGEPSRQQQAEAGQRENQLEEQRLEQERIQAGRQEQEENLRELRERYERQREQGYN